MPLDKTPWRPTKQMPWGKHKGVELQELPHRYLCWLYDQDWLPSAWPGLFAYIQQLDEEGRLDRAHEDYDDPFEGGYDAGLDDIF